MENSYLRCHQKLRKLVALVSLAYAFCLSVGIRAAEKQPIARKNTAIRLPALAATG